MAGSVQYRASLRAVGVSLLIFCGLISVGSFVSGVTVFGRRDIIYGCAAEAPRPPRGGPFYEDTEVVAASRSMFPLGVVCVLDSPENTAGPQTVHIQRWPETIAWITSGGLSLLGVILLVRPAAIERAMVEHRSERSRSSAN